MNRTGKTNTVGEWTTPSAKIGLMYASDYALSLGSSALTLTVLSNTSTLKTGWMHQSNNDTTKSSYEWTLSRLGARSGGIAAWLVHSDGGVSNSYVNYSYGVRPVFYLTSDVNITSDGDGTLENPFIIQE